MNDVSSQIDPGTNNPGTSSTSSDTATAREQAAGLAEAAKNSKVCSGECRRLDSPLTALQHDILDERAIEMHD